MSKRYLRLHESHIYPFLSLFINATKIEKTGVHFKTDVFAAVADVDAKAP